MAEMPSKKDAPGRRAYVSFSPPESNLPARLCVPGVLSQMRMQVSCGVPAAVKYFNLVWRLHFFLGVSKFFLHFLR